MVGGEHSLKMSASQLLPFWIYDVLKIWRKRIRFSVNLLMNDKADCRTAPATPGPLISRLRTVKMVGMIMIMVMTVMTAMIIMMLLCSDVCN